MLCEWTGQNKDTIIDQIDMLKIKVHDKTLKWYFNCIHDQIKDLVSAEI